MNRGRPSSSLKPRKVAASGCDFAQPKVIDRARLWRRSVVVGAGAKILGPILVGDRAKVGSNAVVVRDVPAGATAVGIPARIVSGEDALRRERQAATIGFSAYAISADMNDPMVQAVHSLLDHAAATEERLKTLVELLQRGGFDCGDAKATADLFDPERINRLLE